MRYKHGARVRYKATRSGRLISGKLVDRQQTDRGEWWYVRTADHLVKVRPSTVEKA